MLKPFEEKAELGDIYSSLSFVAGTITNYLLEKSIAHNLIVSDSGTTIYIVPRQHEDNHKETQVKCAWMEIAGLVICREEAAYDTITKDYFEGVLSSQVSLSEEDFAEVKEKIVGIFKKNYQ